MMKNRLYRTLGIVTTAALIIFSAAASDSEATPRTEKSLPSQRGKFKLMKLNMELGRSGHSVTFLKDGLMLISGGGWGDWGGEPKAEIIDTKSERVRTLESKLSTPISNATTVTLPDGRVLMMGGDTDFETGLNSTEYFDPATEAFSQGPEMTVGRSGHSATPLSDGRIVIVGGEQADGQLDSIEIFDPTTLSFQPLKIHLSVPRAHHTATLFDGKKILIAGGESRDGILDSLEWIDLEKMEAVPVATPMSLPRTYHTVTALNSDELLISGGLVNYGESTWDMEILNLKTQKFQAAGRLQAPRSLHTATVLQSGEIFFAGGVASGVPLASTERCQRTPAGVFECRPDANMSTPRWMHVSSPLPDGRILVVGGLTNKKEPKQRSAGPSHTAEIFTP
ncbi:MAG: hypothetical protein RIR26_365 [Pseudomonadota bacterium]|jgi:hypothetical protein